MCTMRLRPRCCGILVGSKPYDSFVLIKIGD